MNLISLLVKELDAEVQATRNMLSRVPDDKWDWKPHPKSMTMMQLTVHLAELPGWISMGLQTDGLDFGANPYQATTVNSKEELLQLFETAQKKGKRALENATEDSLTPSWTMRNGDQIYMVLTKYEVIRHALAQTIHHRAQLGVFLRLLDIPIPGTYGPSADDQAF